MQKKIVQIDGDWWPAEDSKCRPAVMETLKDADEAIKLCKKKTVAVQAGGNCGMWPRYLAKHFETVYTFEPDALNFRCLALNATAPNIIKLQAALGDKRQPISMLRVEDNIGAHRVLDKGVIPQIKLDDLNLQACDLIQLDVEGFEVFAMQGAHRTIERFRPVMMIEDKKHHLKYGLDDDAITALLLKMNYRLLKKVHRDIIMVPR